MFKKYVYFLLIPLVFGCSKSSSGSNETSTAKPVEPSIEKNAEDVVKTKRKKVKRPARPSPPGQDSKPEQGALGVKSVNKSLRFCQETGTPKIEKRSKFSHKVFYDTTGLISYVLYSWGEGVFRLHDYVYNQKGSLDRVISFEPNGVYPFHVWSFGPKKGTKQIVYMNLLNEKKQADQVGSSRGDVAFEIEFDDRGRPVKTYTFDLQSGKPKLAQQLEYGSSISKCSPVRYSEGPLFTTACPTKVGDSVIGYDESGKLLSRSNEVHSSKFETDCK